MKCPTCRGASKPPPRREKPAEADGAAQEDGGNKAYPFCSERCQLVDLGRWLGEEYRIPVDDDEDGGSPPPARGDA